MNTITNLIAMTTIAIFLLILTINLEPEYMFSVDSLVKLYQAESLLANNFTTDSINCSALLKSYDCKYLMPAGFLELNQKLVGPFPIALSFISAILLIVGSPEMGIYVSLILFLITLSVLVFYYQISLPTIGLLVLGTPLFLHVVSFFDVSVSLLFFTIGLIYFKNPQRRAVHNLFLGIVIGLSIFFRNESIILIFFLMVFKLLYSSQKKYDIPFSIGILISVSLFFLLNITMYNSSLGPRVLANEGGLLSTDLYSKLDILKSLFFMEGKRIGFFGYMPFLLLFFFLLFLFKTHLQLSPLNKIFLYGSFSYIIISGLLSPNDSVIDWGSRYFSIALIPIFMSIDTIFKSNNLTKNKILLGLIILLSLYSALTSIKYYNTISKVKNSFKEFQNTLNSVPSDILVFDNRVFMDMSGLEFRKKPVLYIGNPESLEYFLKNDIKEPERKPITAYITLNEVAAALFSSTGGLSKNGDLSKINLQVSEFHQIFSQTKTKIETKQYDFIEITYYK